MSHKFSSNEVVELPKTKLSANLRAELLCSPESVDALIASHVSSAVAQDLSNFARHLSAKAKSFLSKLGLRVITASLFVSTATNQYWGVDEHGDLRRLVNDQVTDGTIDAFNPKLHSDLESAYSTGRLEASLL